MDRCGLVALLAQYNAWMNTKLYEAAFTLSPEEIAADRKSSFGSILGIFNHIMVGDTLWLKRFANHPTRPAALDWIRDLTAPTALDQILFTDFEALFRHRRQMDRVIVRWAGALEEHELDQSLRYANSRGEVAEKDFFSLVTHFFNHQTHHRGQATTLLAQAGVDFGVTDLVALIPDVPAP